MTFFPLKKIFLSLFIFLVVLLSLPKNTLAQSNFGFNVHSLSKTTPENITSILNYLKDECQTTIVRFWGYQSTLGINGNNNIQKVLDAAPSGMKFIIALEDFPYGPAINDPKSWFESGYKISYRPYVEKILNKYGSDPRILVWEIMNEPHCKGDPSCFLHFKNFVVDISALISSKTSAYVSPGLMGGHLTWAQYEEISQLPNITANSCHYNTNTNNPNTCLEALNHRSGTNFFYVGEAGYQGEGNCSGGACTNSNCTNCCDLPVLQKRADQVKNDSNTLIGAGANAFLIWQFSPKGSSTLICDSFSVFPKDPICDGTGDLSRLLEPIVISGASYVCSDFTEKQSPEATASSLPSSSQEEITGNINLISTKISDFETAQRTMSGALRKLLPQNLAENIALPGDTTMYFKHFTQGLKEGKEDEFDPSTQQKCGEAPYEKTTIPGRFWGNLVGATRGLYSFLAPNDPNAPISNFQFQIADTGYNCNVGSCVGGKGVDAKILPKTNKEKTGFKTLGWSIIKFIENIIDQLRNILGIKYSKTKKIKVLTRSKLPAGSTATNLMTGVAQGFLPKEISKTINPYDEARALEAGFQYSIGLSPPVDAGEHNASYYEIKKLRNYYCMRLCSQYPSGINISNIDPICLSCNPDDYKSPAKPRTPCKNPDGTPDWDRNPQDCAPPGCHWNSGYNACDYYEACAPHWHIPHCTAGGPLQHGCGSDQGPVCENCSDLSNALYPDTDLEWCGGEGGPKSCNAHPCQILNRISWENDTYADPAYNGCYYANDGVKVRRNFVGCSGVCNDACPAY